MTAATFNANSGISVGNAIIPKEGPKAVPYNLDFTVNPAYQVDMSYLFQQTAISVLQCVFIDNSNNPDILALTMTGTGQTIVCPAGAQGYFPILSPQSGKMNAASAGAVVVPIIFINVPMAANVWYPNQGPIASGKYDAGGHLETVDQNILANTDPTQGIKTYSSGGSGTAELPSKLLYNGVNAGGYSFLPYAPAGQYTYITGITFLLNADTYGGGANFARMTMDVGGDYIAQINFSAPSAAPAAGTERNQTLLNFNGLLKSAHQADRIDIQVFNNFGGGTGMTYDVWGYYSPN